MSIEAISFNDCDQTNTANLTFEDLMKLVDDDGQLLMQPDGTVPVATVPVDSQLLPEFVEAQNRQFIGDGPMLPVNANYDNNDYVDLVQSAVDQSDGIGSFLLGDMNDYIDDEDFSDLITFTVAGLEGQFSENFLTE